MDISGIPYIGQILSLLCAIFWAFAVVLFKKSGETVHPMSLNLFKNLVGTILFIITFQFINQPIIQPGVTNNDLILIMISGAVGIGIADTLFFQCLNKLGASLTAIVDCFYAPFVILFSFIFLSESMTVLQIVGVMLIIGAIITATYHKDKSSRSRRDTIIGIIYGIVAMILMATGVVIIKPILDKYPLLWVTEMRLISGVAVLILMFIFVPQRKMIFNTLFKSANWKLIFGSSFIGAYLAMILWLAGIKYTQVSTASVLNQTNNIFIFIFAALILKENITKEKIIGILIAFSGAILVTVG